MQGCHHHGKIRWRNRKSLKEGIRAITVVVAVDKLKQVPEKRRDVLCSLYERDSGMVDDVRVDKAGRHATNSHDKRSEHRTLISQYFGDAHHSYSSMQTGGSSWVFLICSGARRPLLQLPILRQWHALYRSLHQDIVWHKTWSLLLPSTSKQAEWKRATASKPNPFKQQSTRWAVR